VQQNDMNYTVDIVLCVDATGSMTPVIDKVKTAAIRFHSDLTDRLSKLEKSIQTLRVRVIAYRDYYADGESAMQTSRFFDLPAEKGAFEAFVHDIDADGGGDEPENGLEALALAIKSDWSKCAGKHRQIVVLWTDASAHPLDKPGATKPSNYPTDMPANLDELTDLWQNDQIMQTSAKCLILYSPDIQPWTEFSSWDNIVHYRVKAGEGLSEVTSEEIVNAITTEI